MEKCKYGVFQWPNTYCWTLQSDDVIKWEKAMQKEYESSMADKTWELIPLPKDCKIMGCK